MGSTAVLGIVTLGGILALIGPQAYHILRMCGYHKGAVKNVHPGACWNVPGIHEGSEDMEPLGDGRVLVTTGLKWPPDNPINPDTKGRILLIDLNQPEPEPVEVKIKGDLELSTFNPLGITKWVNKKVGKITILIINLPTVPQLAVVERFVYSEPENTLYHVETLGLGDKNFYLVDDIVAVGERKFYFTNILAKYPHWEWKFLLPWQSVGFFDGSKSTLVDDGCPGPNGIHISPDRKYVYVSMVFRGFIRTYKRNSDNSLEQVQDYQLPFFADNLMVTDDGDIWATGPIIGHMGFKYMHDPHNELNPTQVMRLTVNDGMVTSSSTVFIDDGELQSGGTTTVSYKDRILMGSVLSKASICQIGGES